MNGYVYIYIYIHMYISFYLKDLYLDQIYIYRYMFRKVYTCMYEYYIRASDAFDIYIYRYRMPTRSATFFITHTAKAHLKQGFLNLLSLILSGIWCSSRSQPDRESIQMRFFETHYKRLPWDLKGRLAA